MKGKIKGFILLIVLLAVLFIMPKYNVDAEISYKHHYDNGICDCGEYEIPESNNFVYEINNAGNYLWLVNLINSNQDYQTVGMNINADLDFAGINFVPINNFKGTIDGRGHRILNVDIQGYLNYFGLIKVASGDVVIKNLIIGSSVNISSTAQCVGGFIGKTNNNSNITFINCGLEGTVKTTTTSYPSTGGFVGNSDSNTISFINCYVTGNIITTGISYFFVGAINSMSSITFTNCFGAGTFTNYGTQTESVTPKTSDMSVLNSYVISDYSSAYFTSVTKEQLASGEVSYLLGGAFGQELGVDSVPLLDGMTVYGSIDVCGEDTYSNTTHTTGGWLTDLENTTHYQYCSVCETNVYEGLHSGSGTCSSLSKCDICNLDFGTTNDHSYEESHYQESEGGHVLVCDYGCGTIKENSLTSHEYECSYIDNNTHLCVCVCGDEKIENHAFGDLICSCGIKEVAYRLTSAQCISLGIDLKYVDYYLIDKNSKFQWFIEKLNSDPGTYCDANLYLTCDVSISEVTSTDINFPFSGVIEGNGNTLTISLEATQKYHASFMYAKAPTFRNLVITGVVNSSSSYTAGLIGNVVSGGNVLFDSIFSTVNANSSGSNYRSALIAENNGYVSFVNSGAAMAFSGSGNYPAALVSYNKGSVNVSNSYFYNTSSKLYIVYNNSGSVTYDNSYVLRDKFNSITSVSGLTVVTETVFKSGKVAALMNSLFGQNIDNGEEVDLYPILNGATVYSGYYSCGVNEYSNITHQTDGTYITVDGYHYADCLVCDEDAFYEECHSLVPRCESAGICDVCEVKFAEAGCNNIYQFDDTNHWMICEWCEEITNLEAHSFSCDCDDSCDCGYEREGSTSDLVLDYDDTNHWMECIKCDGDYNIESHVYDGVCDTTCSNCSYVREITHNYQVAYDTTYHYNKCSSCGVVDVSTKEEHIFTDSECSCSYVLEEHIAVTVDSSNYSSFGLSADHIGYYVISSVDDYLWFVNAVNNGNVNINVVFTTDITLNENLVNLSSNELNGGTFTKYPTIGTSSNRFNGIIDGNGHFISGLYQTTENSAFISYASNVTIKNLTVKDFYFSGNKAVAAVSVAKNVVLSNVNFEGVVYTSYSYKSTIVYSSNGDILIEDSRFVVLSSSSNNYMFDKETDYPSIKNLTINNTLIYTPKALNLTGKDSNVNINIKDSYIIASSKSENRYPLAYFSNGTIMYLMQLEDSTTSYGQTIGTDPYPVLGGAKVYCNGKEFTNFASSCADLGFCNNCFRGDMPTLTNDKYDLDNDGLLDPVYEIKTINHLYWFRSQVNNFYNVDINAILMNDIVVNSDVVSDEYSLNSGSFVSWLPIGSYNYQYSGIFDGNGYKISGLYYDLNDNKRLSLFGYTKGAIIKNVSVVDVYYYSSYSSGIASLATDTVIRNCHFDGYLNGQIWSGGIVITAINSTIIGCTVNGKINSSSNFGYIAQTINNSLVEDCYVKASSSSNSSYIAGVGSQILAESVVRNCVINASVKQLFHNNEGIAKNIYYLSDRSSLDGGRTVEEFSSGKVSYELFKAYAETLFGQELGVDNIPVLGKAKVYCNGSSYTNTLSACAYVDGICTCCGDILPAVLNTNKYDLNSDGILDSVYEIDSVADLLWFAKEVNLGNTKINAILLTDLDLSGVVWNPIGIYSDTVSGRDMPYQGVFDGNYHVISNLNVALTEKYETGFFGRTLGATIKNLGLINAAVANSSEVRAGILAGELQNSTIINVYTMGTVSSLHDQVHGLAGEAIGSIIKNVYTTFSSLTVNASSVVNGYYLSALALDSDGENVTTNALRSGLLTFDLNLGTTNNPVFKQNIGTDLYPSFVGSVVYQVENCLGNVEGYSNDYSAIVHIYDGLCDGSCNNPDCLTGEREGAEHAHNVFNCDDGYHWYECYECGYRTNIVSHTFDNLCDTTCNDVECGFERVVEEHNYSTIYKDEIHHWYGCNKCGLALTKYTHYYSNDCDSICNEAVCSYVRTVDPHTYKYYFDDIEHYYACIFCGVYEINGNHTYVNGICECSHNEIAELVDSYYLIKNAGNLRYFANLVNTGNTSINAKLMANIDLTGVDWTPIGRNGTDVLNADIHAYGGIFDGNGYEIRNLSLHTDERVYVGLFGYTRDAFISNLGLVNVNIATTSNTHTAMLVAYASGTEIRNVYVLGNVSGNNGYVGGMVSYANNVLIESSITDYSSISSTTVQNINSYSMSEFTSEELESGYVAYLLNRKNSSGVWKQTIGVDLYPKLQGDAVYPVYDNCGNIPDGYSNILDNNIPSCDYVDGICYEVEGELHYQTPSLNDLSGYYEIYTTGHLFWFAEYVNLGNQDINAILMADIDLDGLEWTTISQTSIYESSTGLDLGYSGVFDGNYHTISNIYVKGITGTKLTYGLFGTLSGTVQNLGIEGFTYEQNGVSDVRVGSVAGQVLPTGLISNVYVNDVSVKTESFVAGGIAGALYGGTIKYAVVNNVVVNGANNRFGTIIGDGYGSSSSDCRGKISYCYSLDKLYGSTKSPTNTNCYIISSDEMASGKIACDLNEILGETLWRQTLGTDLYPNFSGSHVYSHYINCGDSLWYSNNINDNYDTPQTHVYDSNGICYGVDGQMHFKTPTYNEEGYYEIYSTGEYVEFTKIVNGGEYGANAKLMVDIDLTSLGYVIMGLSQNAAYTGTFDGGYHTIQININRNEEDNVLFGAVNNATIKNLKVSGSIYSTKRSMSGLVGTAYGTTNIENCIIDVDLTSTYSGNYGYVGGVVSNVCGNIYIKNSIYIGSITCPASSYVGGLVGDINKDYGYTNSTISAENVLIYLQDDTNAPYISTLTAETTYTKNVFYVNEHNGGLHGAMQVSEEDVLSGKVAWLLNECSSEGVWRQTIGTDLYPTFTGSIVYPVKVDCTEHNFVSYSNEKSESTFEHAFGLDGICREVSGELHYEAALLNANNYYEIKNVGNLLWFIDYVNSGNYASNAILMNDIDLDGYQVERINTTVDNPYTGTFDGGYHTLSNLAFVEINQFYIVNGQYYYGLFNVLGGTIQNLGVEDVSFSITNTTTKITNVGVLAGYALSGSVIKNCYVANLDAYKGSIYLNFGALAGSGRGSISNTFTYNISSGTKGYTGSNGTGYSNTNSYTTGDGFSADPNKNISVDRFNSGEIAYLLNGSVTDETNIWGQKIALENSDLHPTFVNENNKVYYNKISGCNEALAVYGYTNNSLPIKYHTEVEVDGLCDICGAALGEAKIGQKYFETLESALEVVGSGDTITLITNINKSFTVPLGVTLVVPDDITLTFEEITLNGQLKVYGTLSGGTISGSGLAIIFGYSGEITNENIKAVEEYAYQGILLNDTIIANSSLVVTLFGKDFVLGDWIVSLSNDVLNCGNYQVIYTKESDSSIKVSKDIVVNKVDLTITANNHSIHYNEEASNAGVTYTGFVGSDNETSLTGALIYSYTYILGDVKGNYEINISGLSSDNYNIIFVSGVLEVVCTDHSYNSEYVCNGCGYECLHEKFTDTVCNECGFTHTDHTYIEGLCSLCSYEHTPHEFVEGLCSCGKLAAAMMITEENYDTYFTGYAEKTYIGYYAITHVNELFWFAKFTAEDANAKAVLINDINLGNKEWIPIGLAKSFRGILDGNGHTIANFKLTVNDKGKWGFISNASYEAQLINISINGQIDINVDSTVTEDIYVGLVGYLDWYGIKIINVANEININVINNPNNTYIGGLVGYSKTGSTSKGLVIDKSIYSGTINLGSYKVMAVGGLLGYTYYNPKNDLTKSIPTTNISNSIFNGIIISTNVEGITIGGIIGYGASEYISISNTLSIGEFNVANTTITGGIAGTIYKHYLAESKLINNFTNYVKLYGNDPNISDEITDGYYDVDIDKTGVIVTSDELASGMVTHFLGNAFGQILGSDLYPQLNNCLNTLYAGYYKCSDTKITYTNDNTGLFATLPEHSYDSGVVSKNPTCTERGETLYTCICGATKTEYISKIPHVLSTSWTFDNTYHWHKCEKCDYFESKIEHIWDDGVVTTPSTDEQEGIKTYTCNSCGDTKSESIGKLDHTHTYSSEWSKNDTYHWHNANCVHTTEKTDLGEHDWNDGIITSEVSCTEAGIKTYTCNTCGATKTEDILALGHSFAAILSYNETHHWYQATCGHDLRKSEEEHVYQLWTMVTSEDCNNAEVLESTCECDHSTQKSGKPATGHSFADSYTYDKTHHWYQAICEHSEEISGKTLHVWTSTGVITSASCDETGLEGFICACGMTKEEEIPLLDHTYSSSWSSDAGYHWHIATCEHNSSYIDYASHSWDSGVIKTPATEYEEGVKTYTCIVCSYKRDETIGLLGHEHTYESELTHDETHHWYQASCEHSIEKSEYTEHNFIWTQRNPASCVVDELFDGKCMDCGYETTKVGILAYNHSYSDKYSTDADYHWFNPTCGCIDAPITKESHNHVMSQKTPATCAEAEVLEGLCECGHTITQTGAAATGHSYDETYTYDDKYHWYKALCGCIDAPITKVSHNHVISQKTPATCLEAEVLEGLCECGHTITKTGAAATGHSFAETWKYNDTHHWHEALCDHIEIKDGVALHSFELKEVIDPATCLEEGLGLYECLCGISKEIAIEKTSHTNDDLWHSDANSHWNLATCEHEGEKVNVSTHEWDNGTVIETASCGNPGKKIYTCSVCKYSKEEIIPQLPHTYSSDYTYDDEYHYKKAICGHEAKDSYGPHAWGNGTITLEPSCSGAGEMTYACICGNTKTEVIDALDHTFEDTWTSDDNYHWYKATCVHEGEVSGKAEHSWDNGVITKEPAVDVEGIKIYTCSVCSKTIELNIGLLGHEHTYESELTYDETHHWYKASCEHSIEKKDYNLHELTWNELTPADCNNAQILKGVCSCGYETTKEGNSPKGHSYGQLISKVDSSCESTGTKSHYECSVCHKYFDEAKNELSDLTIAMKDHTYGNLISKVEASCEEDGAKSHYECSTCHKYFDEEKNELNDVVISKTGHTHTIKYDEEKHWKECVCGDVRDTESHSYGEWKVVTEATKDNDGLKEASCSCGHTKTEIIEKQEKSGISTGSIVAIVISSATLLGLVGFVIFWYVVKKENTKKLLENLRKLVKKDK